MAGRGIALAFAVEESLQPIENDCSVVTASFVQGPDGLCSKEEAMAMAQNLQGQSNGK
jgi:hypothetical protein